MEELYIHIHCERENGVSPFMAQISTDEEGVTEIVENSDGNGGMNPTADGTSGQVHELDINSLKFTNKKKEQVFRKVKAMRADQSNGELDDSTLFLTALSGPSHGRVLGFGSLLEQMVKTATTRERQNHSTSYASGLTNTGVQEIFTRAEVEAMVHERDCRIIEERTERLRDQAQNQYMFSQLYKMQGLQVPVTQEPASSPELPQDGTARNMGSLQVQGTSSQPSQELPSSLQIEFNPNQQPNPEVSFQALLTSQDGQEIAGNDAAMSNWWANRTST